MIEFRSATIDELALLKYWDEQPHTVASAAIIIDPLASNVRARKFYERLGFSFVENRTFGEDCCAVYSLDRSAWESSKRFFEPKSAF